MKKYLKKSLLFIGILLLAFIIHYCWVSFPIISGYGAKNMCSAVFLSGRSEQDERAQELHFFPMDIATFSVDVKDSSVTGTVLGLGRRKAIYRTGLGATLVDNELSEQNVRAEKFKLATPPNIDQDSVSWPMGDKNSDTVFGNIDKVQMQQAMKFIFSEPDISHPVRTRAVVVIYDGKIIAEQYAQGFNKGTKLTGWSMTKSITSALTGILVKQHKLEINAPAPVPEWADKNDPRHAITIKNILQQNTGLNFEEDYTKSSDATKMLFEKADMAAFTAQHQLKVKPGSQWYYSSGNTNILSRIIRQSVGESDYHSFPYTQLFYKLGMYHSVMEPDASGTFVGSSYMYATARDWARFGLLYLNNGNYNGEQIITGDWIKQSVEPAADAPLGEYGFMFWLNAGDKNNAEKRTYPSLPTDLFCADGFEGQNIFIIPSKKLVVVRLGLTQGTHYDADTFLSMIIKAIH
jgi:CubicO group peptidase (beta-lactamase class C family)